MNRREAELLKNVAIGMGGAIVVLVIVLVVVLVGDSRQRSALEAQWLAGQQAAPDVPAPEPPDPYDGLEQAAIDRVRGLAVPGGGNVGARVESRTLETRVDALRRDGVSAGEWRASRLRSHTVYQVEFAYRFHAVEFGPRWYVQMNPDGPAPDGSGGVVAVNGLAKQLQRQDPDEDLRYLNRAEEVLQALTEHRFTGGTRLGSALLVFFAGRGDADTRRILGWHVVPEYTDPDEDLIYRAFFQWEEEGEVRDAWWEVNLSNRDFRAKDLQANEIMALGASVAAADAIEIRPRTMDLSQPPAEESNPRRRALRYLLADDRLIEAVGTLLSFRAQTEDLEYVGWEPTVTDERHVYDLACVFREGSEDVRVTWRVNATTGEATPTNDIARTAQLALELVSAAE